MKIPGSRTLAVFLPFFLFGNLSVSGQNGVGTTSFVFLGMPNDAETVSLGHTSVSRIDSPPAVLLNPAGLGFMTATKVSFSHAEHVAAIRNEQFSFGVPIGPGTLGVVFTYLYSSGFEEIVVGLPTGNSLRFWDLLVGAGYGLALIKKEKTALSAGANVLWVQESIAGLKDSLFSAGIGFQIRFLLGSRPSWAPKRNDNNRSFWYNFKAGVAIKNIAGKANIGSKVAPIPLAVALGVQYIPLRYLGLVIEGEFERGNKSAFRFGIEGFPVFYLRPRVGFIFGGGDSLLRAGLGGRIPIGKTDLTLNYAIDPGSEAGISHWFTISLETTRLGGS